MAQNPPPVYSSGGFKRLQANAETRQQRLIVPITLPEEHGVITFSGAPKRAPGVPNPPHRRDIDAKVIVTPNAIRLRTEDEEALTFAAPVRTPDGNGMQNYHPFTDADGNDLPVAALDFEMRPDPDYGRAWEYVGPCALHAGSMAVEAVGLIFDRLAFVTEKRSKGPGAHWQPLDTP